MSLRKHNRAFQNLQDNDGMQVINTMPAYEPTTEAERLLKKIHASLSDCPEKLEILAYLKKRKLI